MDSAGLVTLHRRKGRRIRSGAHVLLADVRQANTAAEVLSGAGFDTNTAVVNVFARDSVRALARTAADFG